MSERQFILCDKYLVEKDGKNGKPKKLAAIYTWNEYGDQGRDKYTFHVEGKDGIETISGTNGNLVPLKWHQQDTYKAGILGGIIGFLASLAIMYIQNKFFPDLDARCFSRFPRRLFDGDFKPL